MLLLFLQVLIPTVVIIFMMIIFYSIVFYLSLFNRDRSNIKEPTQIRTLALKNFSKAVDMLLLYSEEDCSGSLNTTDVFEV